jgi:hypothetical protein
MRLALSKAEGWVTLGTASHTPDPGSWWRGVTEAARRFDDVAARAGGAPAGFRRYLDVAESAGPMSSVEKVRDDVGRAAALGFTDAVIAWPRAEEPFAGSERILEHVGAELNEFGELPA